MKDLKQAGTPGTADFKLKTGVMIKMDDHGNVSLLERRPPYGSNNIQGAIENAFAVLPHPAGVIAGHADVKNPPRPAGEKINAEDLFH